MWKQWFDFCNLLVGLIPSRTVRAKIRHERLYDYDKKLNALRLAQPDLNFRHIKMIKGGWNIGFVIDKKYVFKIRKFYNDKTAIAKILREKAITDAFANIVPIRIPNIEIINANKYMFYRYEFIAGKNLNEFSPETIKKHHKKIGKQLGEFIFKMHNAYPSDIADLATPVEKNADGWNHNDLCNNIIVNPKTMKIVGIIDWEYAGYGKLESEFANVVQFKTKIRESGILDVIRSEYLHLMECD